MKSCSCHPRGQITSSSTAGSAAGVMLANARERSATCAACRRASGSLGRQRRE
jgi:hypothetical protein